eukprot:TRINITY_DN94254_c0_g1_i1.p1 TRINITY_DN94254_c0_g1~~TRINITY_DN94254_c0_g1_i1.p1  ORF type:complete len:532 (-),score=95.61 TRINITY_DN94254_c0_g1_i1:83-1678(-)
MAAYAWLQSRYSEADSAMPALRGGRAWRRRLLRSTCWWSGGLRLALIGIRGADGAGSCAAAAAIVPAVCPGSTECNPSALRVGNTVGIEVCIVNLSREYGTEMREVSADLRSGTQIQVYVACSESSCASDTRLPGTFGLEGFEAAAGVDAAFTWGNSSECDAAGQCGVIHLEAAVPLPANSTQRCLGTIMLSAEKLPNTTDGFIYMRAQTQSDSLLVSDGRCMARIHGGGQGSTAARFSEDDPPPAVLPYSGPEWSEVQQQDCVARCREFQMGYPECLDRVAMLERSAEVLGTFLPLLALCLCCACGCATVVSSRRRRPSSEPSDAAAPGPAAGAWVADCGDEAQLGLANRSLIDRVHELAAANRESDAALLAATAEAECWKQRADANMTLELEEARKALQEARDESWRWRARAMRDPSRSPDTPHSGPLTGSTLLTVKECPRCALWQAKAESAWVDAAHTQWAATGRLAKTPLEQQGQHSPLMVKQLAASTCSVAVPASAYGGAEEDSAEEQHDEELSKRPAEAGCLAFL